MIRAGATYVTAGHQVGCERRIGNWELGTGEQSSQSMTRCTLSPIPHSSYLLSLRSLHEAGSKTVFVDPRHLHYSSHNRRADRGSFFDYRAIPQFRVLWANGHKSHTQTWKCIVSFSLLPGGFYLVRYHAGGSSKGHHLVADWMNGSGEDL